MTVSTRLDLPRIEATLREMQQSPGHPASSTGAVRDPIDGHMIGNMVEGYRCVEWFVNEAVDIFALGESRHLLELNRIVLCGIDPRRRREHAGHLVASERRFYEEPNAGIEDLIEWYRLNTKAPVWDLAAGAYIRILSTPQLYIEGNHRTGALVMSYILMRVGQPPFVLTSENATGYFATSSEIRDIRKNSLGASFQLPGIRRRLAELLRQESNPLFLRPALRTSCAPPSGSADA